MTGHLTQPIRHLSASEAVSEVALVSGQVVIFEHATRRRAERSDLEVVSTGAQKIAAWRPPE
jgi:hypothetical protein